MTASKSKSDISKKHILLIEDNPGDVRLIQEMLRETGEDLFEVTHADRLSGGLSLLDKGTFDLILLDLSLPDSCGLETFAKVHQQARDIPIVVMTGMNDLSLATKSLREGAQDYLVKEETQGDLLVRSIRYALERFSLLKELEESRRQAQEKKERDETMRNFQHYVALGGGGGIARHLEALSQEYRAIVLQYVRALRINEDRPSDRVKTFAVQLAGFGCRARDLVHLHLGVLNEFSQKVTPAEERAFFNDARLVLVELMGNIMDIYGGSQKIFPPDVSSTTREA